MSEKFGLFARRNVVEAVARKIAGGRIPPNTSRSFPAHMQAAILQGQARKIETADVDEGFRSAVRANHADHLQEFDQTANEWMLQRRLDFETPWGEMSAAYVVLNREKLSRDGSKPIVLIPGASNGLESVDTLARAMAERYRDRPIIVLAHPDAPSGFVTQDFTQAVENSQQGFEPHAQFFELMLQQVEESEGIKSSTYDFWGWSTGCPIIGRMLRHDQTQDRIGNVVLLNPWASVEQSNLKFSLGMAADLGISAKYLSGLLRYVFMVDQTAKSKDKNKPSQADLRWQTLMAVQKQGVHDWLRQDLAEMPESKGSVVIINSGADNITNSKAAFAPGKEAKVFVQAQNQRARFETIRGHTHIGLMVEPEEFLQRIDRAQAALNFERPNQAVGTIAS